MTNQKTKGPGDNVIIRLKSKEKPETLKWLNAQTNLAESIRFLIELETLSNGIKNYSEIIPQERSEQFLIDYLINELTKKRAKLGIKESIEQTATAIELQQFEHKDIVVPKISVETSEIKNIEQVSNNQDKNSNEEILETDLVQEKLETKPKRKKIIAITDEDKEAWS